MYTSAKAKGDYYKVKSTNRVAKISDTSTAKRRPSQQEEHQTKQSLVFYLSLDCIPSEPRIVGGFKIILNVSHLRLTAGFRNTCP
jgi:hypothetical protein